MTVLRSLLLLVLVLFGCLGWGQSGEGVQLNLSGPRDAFVSFRQVLSDEGATAAAGAVSFQGLSAELRGPGRFELVRKLGDVLDSDDWDPDEIPLAGDQDRVVLRTYTRSDVGEEVIGQIVLSKGTDGQWRFDPTTIASVEQIWEVRVEPSLEKPSTQTGEGGEGESSGEGAVDVAKEVASPRATLSTFFDAMNADPPDYQLARSTMDLGELSPLVQERLGNQYATWILGILNRTKYIEIEEVPDRATGEPYEIEIEATQGRVNRLLGSITLAPAKDGRWLFTAETLSTLEEIWVEVQGMPTIGGLKEIQVLDNRLARWIRLQLGSEWIQPGVLGLERWQVVAVPAALALAYFAGVFLRVILKLFVRLRWKKNADILNNQILRYSGNGFGMLVTGALLNLVSNQFGLTTTWRASVVFLMEVVTSVGVVLIALAILEIIGAVLIKKVKTNQERTERLVIPLVRNFGRALIVLIAVVYVFFRVGFDVSSLITGLGVGSLIFALAAKDSIENVFGSLTVLFEMPFQIGDWVIVGDIEGNVETISLRSTRIRTFADSLILVPNSKFIASPVENMGSRRYRRIKTVIGITYDTPPDTIEEFLRRVRLMVEEHEHTWKEKMLIHFNDFGPSSLDIQLYIFVEAPTWPLELAYREDILLKIVRIAQELGVEFAFPTQTLIIDGKNSKGSLGSLLKAD